MKKIIAIIGGSGSVIIGIIFFWPQPCEQNDYVLYQDTTFTTAQVFIVADTDERKFIFRNCVFDSVDIKFLSYKDEYLATEDMYFDSIVFENCRFPAFDFEAIRIRGAHKYVKIEGCTFTAQLNGKKNRAMSITAKVPSFQGFNQRVGKVIIRGNVINDYERGGAIFGQKLSEITIERNEFNTVDEAIKLDDVMGDSLNQYPTEVIIRDNEFNVDHTSYSAITLENSIWISSTQGVKITNNKFYNHTLKTINGDILGLEITDNLFDLTELPNMTTENRFRWMMPVRSGDIVTGNRWLRDEDSRGYSLDIFQGVSDSVLTQNIYTEWDYIKDRR